MNDFFLVKRTYGKSIFLHPFLKKRSAAGYDQEAAVTVYISDKIDQEEKDECLYEMYSGIDRSVNNWIQELKYIPRLINSALAFLIMYFFLSLVIRDPIPVIDELLISVGAAIGIYLWTAARNRKSDIAMKKRVELKNQAEQAAFTIKQELKDIEMLLKEYDEMSDVTLADKVCGDEGGLVAISGIDADSGLGKELRDYMHALLARNDRHRKLIKRLPAVNTDREIRTMSAHLLNMAGRKKIDLPLLALYFSIT